jgi:hypothetical protein
MGDLEQAQSWCRKSKEVYRNNLAENYLKILEQRVNEAKVVEGQMQ